MTITEACEWPITCGHSVCATGQRLGMAGVRHVQGRCLTHVSTKPFESFTRSASSALIAARAAASAAAFTAAFAFAFSSSTSAALMARPWVRGVMGMPYALSAMMAIVRRPQDPRKKGRAIAVSLSTFATILGNLMKGKIKIFGSLVCLIARARRTRHPRSRASWVCPLCALAPLPPSRVSASLSPQPSGPAELIESERPSSKAVHSGPGRTAVGSTSANRSGKMLHRARSQGIHCTTIGGRGRQECQPTASPLLHLRLLHLLLHLLLLGVAAPFDRQDARESAQLHKGKDIIRKLGQGEPRSVRVE